MNDADVRALQVKMLTEDQIRRLHAGEIERGSSHPSNTITVLFRLQPIKEYYGVTTKGRVNVRALHEWAGRVFAILERFSRETGLRRHAMFLDDIHLYDWAIWRSDLDFYYKTATPAKRATGWRGTPENG